MPDLFVYVCGSVVATREILDVPEAPPEILYAHPVDEGVRVLAPDAAAVICGQTGQVAFTASADHATITGYYARVRVAGVATVLTPVQSLGKPTPDANGIIIVDCSTTFATIAATYGEGNYTVSILTVKGTDQVDSTQSAPFYLPLP